MRGGGKHATGRPAKAVNASQVNADRRAVSPGRCRNKAGQFDQLKPDREQKAIFS
jgi:hypothetical protein